MTIARYSLVPVLVALAAGWSATASAQTNVPPPPKPAPAPATPVSDAAGAIGAVNDVRSLGFDALVHGTVTDAEGLKQAGQVSKGFNYFGRALTGVKVADGLSRGDTAPMYEAAAGEAIDYGVARLCQANGPAVAVPCGLAYQGGKLVGNGINYGVKSWTGREIGDHAYDAYAAAKHKVFPETDPDNDAFWEARKQEFQSRFTATRAANEDAVAQAAAAQQASVAPDTSFADMLAGITNFLPANGANPTPVPFAPTAPETAPAVADPTGCHPGHDEQAHPGGCHKQPSGAQ